MALAHEQAGDEASNQLLFAAAAQWYHRAFVAAETSTDDRLRIGEKLKNAYFMGANSADGYPVTEWLASSYASMPREQNKAIEALIDVAAQLHFDLRTKEALEPLSRAAALAEHTGLHRLRNIVDLHRIRYLQYLERNAEALQLLSTIPEPTPIDSAHLKLWYYRAKSHDAALNGDLQGSEDGFERALLAANQSDATIVATLLGFQSWDSLLLGQTRLAKSRMESAIFVVREHNILWAASFRYVTYADILMLLGEYVAARDYVKAAFALRGNTIGIILANAGLKVGLKLNDYDLVEHCAQQSALDLSFRDGNPYYIASLTAAHAELHIAQGDRRSAKVLLRRALSYVHKFAFHWDYLLCVARYGFREDLGRARSIVASGLQFSYNGLCATTLDLFDAFVARRNRNFSQMRVHASKAASGFAAFHWYGYADQAQSLINGDQMPTRRSPPIEAFASISPALSVRERQVAELVIRGLTNKAIGKELDITENTVEKYMTAIMGRLGIRSRYQLPLVLEEPPDI